MIESERVSILIVDDHPVFRYGLAAMIADQSDFDLVGEAASGEMASEMHAKFLPRVTLVDLSLPDIDGIELISRLKKDEPKSRFIVLTTRMSGDDINRALKSGAQAYLFKDCASSELIVAIRMVAAGGRYVPPSVGRKAEEIAHALDLTTRERELLLWMARGLSNEKIGLALHIAPETVKSHAKNIINKLGLKSRSEVVAMCLRVGLVRAENL